jgi:hypothetical protein
MAAVGSPPAVAGPEAVAEVMELSVPDAVTAVAQPALTTPPALVVDGAPPAQAGAPPAQAGAPPLDPGAPPPDRLAVERPSQGALRDPVLPDPTAARPGSAEPVAAPATTTTVTITTDNPPATHVLQPGEHLWSVADSHLRSVTPAPSQSDIAAYWRTVVTATAPSLRSGDPDLVYPGESVTLPEITTT